MLSATSRLRHCLLPIGRSYSLLRHVPSVKLSRSAEAEHSQPPSSGHSEGPLQQMADPLLQTIAADNPPVVFYHYPCADGGCSNSKCVTVSQSVLWCLLLVHMCDVFMLQRLLPRVAAAWLSCCCCWQIYCRHLCCACGYVVLQEQGRAAALRAA